MAECRKSDRELHLCELATKLEFDVEKRGGRFTLTRRADVSRTVRHADLTIEQAEDLLSTWKLRGEHGG